jgi:hypothetical protein
LNTIVCRYGVVSVNKCGDCVYSQSCEPRKSYLQSKHTYWQDRGPDAATNDYIYGRGEFDPFAMSKYEIKEASRKYRLVIATVISKINPGGTGGC